MLKLLTFELINQHLHPKRLFLASRTPLAFRTRRYRSSSRCDPLKDSIPLWERREKNIRIHRCTVWNTANNERYLKRGILPWKVCAGMKRAEVTKGWRNVERCERQEGRTLEIRDKTPFVVETRSFHVTLSLRQPSESRESCDTLQPRILWPFSHFEIRYVTLPVWKSGWFFLRTSFWNSLIQLSKVY